MAEMFSMAAPSGASRHLPRERGRIGSGDVGSSPAKRGRGTMRSMVEGASL